MILSNIVYKDIKYVYIAGSIMEGFGNKTSDIDVYVIVNGELDSSTNINALLKGRSLKTENQFVNNFIEDGIRYDYEYWTFEEWETILNKLNKLYLNESDDFNALSSKEYDLLHRLKYAEPIFNEDEFNTLKTNIKFDNLNKYCASNKSELYSNILEDIEGALLSEDIMSSLIMSRMLLDETLSGYIGFYGETNPNKKWLYRKLSNYAQKQDDKELLEKYLMFLTSPKSLDKDTVIKYVKDVVRFCQQLNTKTQNSLIRKG